MIAPLHRECCNFITCSVVGVFVVVTGENTLCSLGPVVRSSSSRHWFVRGCLSQVTTIWVKEEKVFQFYSIDSVKRRNIKKLEKGWSRSHVNGWRRSHVNTGGGGHMSQKKHTPLVFCFFWGVTCHTHTHTHTHLLTHTLSVQINTHLKLPLGDQGANRRRIAFILAQTHSLARTSNGALNCFTPFLHPLIP